MKELSLLEVTGLAAIDRTLLAVGIEPVVDAVGLNHETH
jgi:hypothetical protein